ncbi:hypothetical protein KOW79_007159 [Hemibagrus wyckioides]|uniref:Protein kinase domain-containing protein n=1 Tax=Hemibagrus wyckioides TaxID=337641 RepID=A0A9D3SMQ3_9TELE|nr:hypothetical protein KOW79_007159 [Hemibagrus wyckioides]
MSVLDAPTNNWMLQVAIKHLRKDGSDLYITVLSEKLHQGKEEEPEWLVNLRQLYADGVYKLKNSGRGLMTSEMFKVFESLYTPGELLGEGGFGSVCAGVRNADGKQVAIKHLRKDGSDLYITVAQVEEFEKKLTAVHTKGLEDEEREQQLEKQKNTPVPKSARRPTRGCGKSQMDDSDLVTPKTSHARPKIVITFSSDEEEEEEDAVMAESETPKVTTPISRTRRTHLHH